MGQYPSCCGNRENEKLQSSHHIKSLAPEDTTQSKNTCLEVDGCYTHLPIGKLVRGFLKQQQDLFMCTICVPSTCGYQKRALNHQELELPMIVSQFVGAGS